MRDAGSPPRVRGKAPKTARCASASRITPARAGKSARRWAGARRARDHPRACGEKLMDWQRQAVTEGSPPRVRGKARAPNSKRPALRITPARAGKSMRSPWTTWCERDHPRACGGKPDMKGMSSIASGSPPRVRGKAGHEGHVLHRLGITPARAGKSGRPRNRRHRPRDHPRACGEKVNKEDVPMCRQGSPPRVRGKVGQAFLERIHIGITPARAGKSNNRGRARWLHRDHPRACGEKELRHADTGSHVGSPPRVRGKDDRRGKRQCSGGITPARAGKSYTDALKLFLMGDHPRACGEKLAFASASALLSGSPPRVRGKVAFYGLIITHKGITPARAGKSRRTGWTNGWRWDHPRACGEKQAEGMTEVPCVGSPPRVRGKGSPSASV